MFEEAIEEIQKTVEISGGIPQSVSSLAHAFAVSGKRNKALKILDDLKEQSRRRYISAYDVAIIYAGLGDRKQVADWLEKAYQERSIGLASIKVDPRFDPLRSDPRLQDLLRRIGLPP